MNKERTEWLNNLARMLTTITEMSDNWQPEYDDISDFPFSLSFDEQVDKIRDWYESAVEFFEEKEEEEEEKKKKERCDECGATIEEENIFRLSKGGENELTLCSKRCLLLTITSK